MGVETDSVILYVIVTLGAAIIGASIQAFGPSLWEMLPRSGPTFPILKGDWDASWFVGEGAKERIFIKDTLRLTQRGRSVSGVGRDAKGHGDYVLHGRFNSHGVVTMSYEYKDAAMAGSMTLKVKPASKMCYGRWHGYSEDEEVIAGRVEWTKKA